MVSSKDKHECPDIIDNQQEIIVFQSTELKYIFGFSEKSVQKENEVEAEQIKEGTTEKGQDHDPGEKVNRVVLDNVSGQLRNTNEVKISLVTILVFVRDCHSTGTE